MRWRRGRKTGKKRSGIRRVFRWIWRGGVIFVVGSVLWVLLYRFVPPPITFTQIGDRIAGHHISRDWMPIERINRNMVRAAIAAEDSKFCSHYGFDQDAIAEAMRRNAEGGSVIRGGSTISQQTAKNAFLWQGGGYVRKGLEAWFTLLIETIWGKERIMEVYLNVAETGLGTYGVNAGSQRYFNHDASMMSRTEAARIAAVLPLPKKRGVVAPKGFTRRYGNSISGRIGVVAREGLDACVYSGKRLSAPDEPAPAKPTLKTGKAPPPSTPAEPQVPQIMPGEEYEAPSEPASPAPPTASDAAEPSAPPPQ